MFPVFVNDGQSEMPSDDILYIVAKEGIFMKKKLGIMESIVPVKNISILETIQCQAQMHIDPIPAMSFAKVIEFFRAVCKKYGGEAIVLLFYNESTKRYKIVPPQQKVSAGSLDYNRQITIDGYTMAGDIHSHARMSAFHSGVDDSDEESFDGLHITIGNLDCKEVSISTSIVSNGTRFIAQSSDYIKGIKKVLDIDEEEVKYKFKIYKHNTDGKLVLNEEAMKRNSYTTRKLDKRYVTTISPSKRQFPEKWMTFVEKSTFYYGGRHSVYNYNGNFPYSRGIVNRVYGAANNQGGNYWNKQRRWGRGKNRSSITYPTTAVPTRTNNLATNKAPIEDYGNIDTLSPCFTCRNVRDRIFIEENETDVDTLYHCTKCGAVINEETDVELICPKCKTNDHLALFEVDENDNYEVRNDLEEDYVEDDNSANLGTYKCKECAASFPLFQADEVCPFCYSTIMITEDNLVDTQRQDSGATLSEESEVKAVSSVDSYIQDPEKETIPIAPPKQKELTWKDKLRKAFIGGKE